MTTSTRTGGGIRDDRSHPTFPEVAKEVPASEINYPLGSGRRGACKVVDFSSCFQTVPTWQNFLGKVRFPASITVI